MDNWYDAYEGAKICNIRRGDGERNKYVYAEIRDANDNLLVSADLDYCSQRMIQVTGLLKPEK